MERCKPARRARSTWRRRRRRPRHLRGPAARFRRAAGRRPGWPAGLLERAPAKPTGPGRAPRSLPAPCGSQAHDSESHLSESSSLTVLGVRVRHQSRRQKIAEAVGSHGAFHPRCCQGKNHPRCQCSHGKKYPRRSHGKNCRSCSHGAATARPSWGSATPPQRAEVRPPPREARLRRLLQGRHPAGRARDIVMAAAAVPGHGSRWPMPTRCCARTVTSSSPPWRRPDGLPDLLLLPCLARPASRSGSPSVPGRRRPAGPQGPAERGSSRPSVACPKSGETGERRGGLVAAAAEGGRDAGGEPGAAAAGALSLSVSLSCPKSGETAIGLCAWLSIDSRSGPSQRVS
jgi:hypothetical protein